MSQFHKYGRISMASRPMGAKYYASRVESMQLIQVRFESNTCIYLNNVSQILGISCFARNTNNVSK